jgi:hypothetical protein
MTATTDYRIRAQYPELREFFEWEGWPEGCPLLHRWRIGEVCWILKEGGAIEHKGNATGVLRDKAAGMDLVSGLDGMTTQQWSNLLGEMAGMAPNKTRRYQWRPALIMRRLDGTRTKRLEVNPAAPLPPNPMPMFALHLEKTAAAREAREARRAAEEAEAAAALAMEQGPVVDIPEPGEGKAKLDLLLGRVPPAPAANGFPDPKPDPAPPTPAPAPTPPPPAPEPERVGMRAPRLFENDDQTIVVPPERAVLDVDEMVASGTGDDLDVVLGAPDPQPFLVEPRTGLADELSRVGNRSLVDNARMLLSLASDMLTQAFVAEAAQAQVQGEANDQALERLSVALGEANRLRKKLQTAETVKQQAEALARRTEAALRAERERADILEGNVQRLLRGEKAENTAALRGAQKFLAEKPRTPVGA